MNSLWSDVRYAARKLAKAPAFAVTAVLTLALGIGAATDVFSLVDAALLRPLPFASPDQLVVIRGTAGPERDVRWASYPEVRDWREMTRSFSAVSIFAQGALTLTGTDDAEVLQSETVSPGYFELLGVAAQLGRAFLPEDDRANATPSVVISDSLWKRRFAAAPDVVGTTITLEQRPAVVIGVMPAAFSGVSFGAEIWRTLLPFAPELEHNRGNRWLPVIGRLAAGVSTVEAQADLRAAARELADAYPGTNRDRSADVVSLRQFYLGDARILLLAVLGGVTLLLLIACVNVANLQIMRSIGRRGELALRHALGAGRGRLLRQLTIESLVLASAGGLLGVGAAYVGLGPLRVLVPLRALGGYVDPVIDVRVLLFATLVTGLAGLAAGVAPALRSTRRFPAYDLHGAGRNASGATAEAGGLQRALVVVEVTLAVALAGTAALMARSLIEQLDVDPGFEADRVIAARLALPSSYSAGTRSQFVTRLIDELESRGGIASAAIGSDAPLLGSYSASMLSTEERPEIRVRYYRHSVTPEYFDALGISLLGGRGFGDSDSADAPRVAVVSDAFARKVWPQGGPIGRTLLTGPSASPERVTVVGVAGDARFRDLTTDLMDPGEDPDIYFPYAQASTASFEIIVRSATPEPIGIEVVRRAVADLDATLPPVRAMALQLALRDQTSGPRTGSAILGAFGILAMVLASVGLYGVMAFAVASRRRELAIRTAIGAEPSRLFRQAIRQGITVVALGIGAGVIVLVILGRLLATILFEVRTSDPAVLGAVAALGLIAIAACAIPAARAARTNPSDALRYE